MKLKLNSIVLSFLFILPGFAVEVSSSVSGDGLILNSSAKYYLYFAKAGVTHELSKIGCENIKVEYSSESMYMIASKFTLSFSANCPETIERVSLEYLNLYTSRDSRNYKHKSAILLVKHADTVGFQKIRFEFDASETEEYLLENFNIPPQVTFNSVQKYGGSDTECGAENIQLLDISLEKKAYFCENLNLLEIKCLQNFGVGNESTIDEVAKNCVEALK